MVVIMVIVKLMGGLGNQMFQYSLARALLANGKDVRIDCSGFQSQAKEDTVRNYELDRFNIKVDKASEEEVSHYNNKIQKLLYYIQTITGFKISKLLIESEHCYFPQITQMDEKYLIGYWQSEKYFTSIRDKLIQDFSFDDIQLSEKNVQLRNEILSVKNPVAVHIRGGDYNNSNNRSIYGNICTAEYYHKAFEYIESRLDDVIYYLFTNDLEWAKQIISLNTPQVKVVDWNIGEDSWIDMYIMSLCKHNIIANSSFSWWSAWLNQNQDKIVIAPKRWQNGNDIKDIVPEQWMRF